MPRAPLAICLVLASLAACADERRLGVAHAPLLTAEEATLLGPEREASDQFGVAVVISGDGLRALVGANWEEPTGRPPSDDSGAAHVFVRTGTTWAHEATLVAPDAAAGDRLGGSVALSNDGSVALVGATSDDTIRAVDAGSARVFVRTGSTWTPEASLISTDGALRDALGSAVALSADGSVALVGARDDDLPGASDAGTARIFRRSGGSWLPEDTLAAAGGATGDAFGAALALSADGTRALVAATYDDTARGTNTGSVRSFRLDAGTWVEEATLLPADAAADDRTGGSVALAGDASRALLGMPLDDAAGEIDVGSVRVYARTGTAWTEEATLRASDGLSGDVFGYVALSADAATALVGAPTDRDASGVQSGSARVFVRSGTAWTEEATLWASDRAAGDAFGAPVSLSADGRLALVGVFSDDVSFPDTGSARVFSIAPSGNGAACVVGATCASGHCSDGVCCDAACGSGASDCQACVRAITGRPDGTCAPLAIGTTCRAGAGGICDVPESCDGIASACPADRFAAPTAVCRLAGGPCDAPEACTGTSAACPADTTLAPGTVCRAATGPCDTAEVCDGATAVCPGDGFEPAGDVCGGGAGDCSLLSMCTGTSALCPSAGAAPAGTPCRPSVGPCDVADVCDGASTLCADTFAPSSTACGSPAMDVCDAADHCAGSSAACVDAYLAGVECRASSGVCDVADVCSGAAAACPPDGLLSAGVSCRASLDPSCDPEEVCDGIASACPLDLSTCAAPDGGALADGGSSDAGPGGPGVDAPAVGTDAGGPTMVATGCGCRAGRGGSGALAAIGLAALLVRHRGRRARAQ